MALHRHSHALVEVLPPEADSSIQAMQARCAPSPPPAPPAPPCPPPTPRAPLASCAAATRPQMTEKPDVTYADLGGMDMQKQEIKVRARPRRRALCARARARAPAAQRAPRRRAARPPPAQEAVELPLSNPELYAQIGIDPPRGVLMYGPPGTGKTMMAKAVANATSAAFIAVVASEFVQKYLGEGPRMVRDVFRLARENAPAIIFIDEVDAVATKRFDSQTGADREVQRILLELLTQMDGFDQSTNVKVIMATNRHDTLDPALMRPGRLDRKIEFPCPDRRQKRLIYQAVTAKMNLSEEVDLEDYVNRPEKVSAAEIASIAAEAGLQAVRNNRYVVLPADMNKAWAKVVKKADTEHLFYE